MSVLAVTPPPIPFVTSGALRSVGIGVALTALADWLFYDRAIGISLTLFLIALAAAVPVANPLRASRRDKVAALTALTAALAPSVEEAGGLSALSAASGVAVFALVLTGGFSGPAMQRAADIVWVLVSGPPRLAGDIWSAARHAVQARGGAFGASWLVAWIAPAALGCVFVYLLTAANPLIERWLAGLDLSAIWRAVDPQRLAFWLLVASFVWPFVVVRLPPRLTWRSRSPVPAGASPAAERGLLFGKAAILRSLVLFNALFAVQTVLDVAYLWGGAALPEGMSYAAYAHRGAYPLIVTALLAGAFVLAAMRPGSAGERSPPIRLLVYLWIAQNVLLVASSILRLDLYVDVYALTRWRIAAFVWMFLVAIGLVLIVARIVLSRSNGWLISMNAAALAVVLYACAFVDFERLIADFNVTHSQEYSGAGVPLDLTYLCTLGPAAIPAMDRYAEKARAVGRPVPVQLVVCRFGRELAHRVRMHDWRGWSFRGYRLARYLRADGWFRLHRRGDGSFGLSHPGGR